MNFDPEISGVDCIRIMRFIFHITENTMLASFDIKFVWRDQKQRRNGEACRAMQSDVFLAGRV